MCHSGWGLGGVGWDKNINANLNMHGTQYHALGLAIGWGHNVHVNLNALWVLFLNRTLCCTCTNTCTHTRHATLWGSSGALAHTCHATLWGSSLATARTWKNICRMESWLVHRVCLSFLSILYNSMTSGSEIPDRPCSAWLSHRLKSEMSYSTNIWMRNTAGE